MRPPTHKPNVRIKMNGPMGNAFGVMGLTKRALMAAGADREYCAEYTQKAMAGDYDNLLEVTREYADLEEY